MGFHRADGLPCLVREAQMSKKGTAAKKKKLASKRGTTKPHRNTLPRIRNLWGTYLMIFTALVALVLGALAFAALRLGFILAACVCASLLSALVHIPYNVWLRLWRLEKLDDGPTTKRQCRGSSIPSGVCKRSIAEALVAVIAGARHPPARCARCEACQP